MGLRGIWGYCRRREPWQLCSADRILLLHLWKHSTTPVFCNWVLDQTELSNSSVVNIIHTITVFEIFISLGLIFKNWHILKNHFQTFLQPSTASLNFASLQQPDPQGKSEGISQPQQIIPRPHLQGQAAGSQTANHEILREENILSNQVNIQYLACSCSTEKIIGETCHIHFESF